jgi:hypothetical protein
MAGATNRASGQLLGTSPMRITRVRFSLGRLMIVVAALGVNFGVLPWPASGVMGAALALPLIVTGGTLLEWITIYSTAAVLAALTMPAVATNCARARAKGLALRVKATSVSSPDPSSEIPEDAGEPE